MPTDPLILGHRGASAIAPENTLAAFSRAIGDGADGIEFDVRLSSDGVPVVIHDATLNRTGRVDRAVSELTAARLGETDVGSWFMQSSRPPPNSFSRETVPMLTQVFDLFKEVRGVLYIEMKCERDEGQVLAAEVVRLIRGAGMRDRAVVESFDHSAIASVKQVDAGIRTAALFEPKLSRPISTARRLKMVDSALAVGADEIALHHRLANVRVVEKARQAGLDVVVWTVDEPGWISRARVLGIKALIANDPGTMVHARNLPRGPGR